MIKAKVIDRSKNNMCKVMWLTDGPSGEKPFSHSSRFYHTSVLKKIHANLIEELNLEEKQDENSEQIEIIENFINGSDDSDYESVTPEKKIVPIRKSKRNKIKKRKFEFE